MNSIIWIFLILALVEADKNIESIQRHHNKSIHFECFDVFIALINRLSNDGMSTTEKCVNVANDKNDKELTAIKNTRLELHSEIKRIRETLAHCTSRNDYKGYFECLNGIVENDRKIVSEIATKSSMYSNRVKNIEDEKIHCFDNSVIKLKDKISNAIKNLRFCLISESSSSVSENEVGMRSGYLGQNNILTTTTATTVPYNSNESNEYSDNDYN